METKARLGLALCGSYCTYAQVFAACEALREKYELIPIMSETAAETDTRFGAAAEHIRRLMELTGRRVITTIAEAEPLGPAEPLDALLIAFSTNDGLSGSAENIARLLNRKHVYFVPFRQDDPQKKPNSLQADFTLLEDALEAALRGEQLQPLLC